MPEGDTVLLAATRMHTALAGQRLVATDFRVPRFAQQVNGASTHCPTRDAGGCMTVRAGIYIRVSKAKRELLDARRQEPP